MIIRQTFHILVSYSHTVIITIFIRRNIGNDIYNYMNYLNNTYAYIIIHLDVSNDPRNIKEST